jgi:hypothetical protein
MSVSADQHEIFELLDVDVDSGKIVITGVQLPTWGKEVLVECAYEGKPFHLLFDGCTSIQWDTYGQPDEEDKIVEVVGIFLGDESHQESAIICSDIFEIAVLYDTFTLVKDW